MYVGTAAGVAAKQLVDGSAAAVQADLVTRGYRIKGMERRGRYKAYKAPPTDLVFFVHVSYSNKVTCKAREKILLSRYAIWHIEWDGRVGGAEETVLAGFHINNGEATKNQNSEWANKYNKVNQFMSACITYYLL